MTDSTLSTRYEPKLVEERWYQTWEFAGLFRPEYRRSPDRYCITIPPPNVTGSLHMGHALCYSIQDVLGRWKRMQGFEVLILPGTDHAGIATQKVVEQQLKAEGKTRFDLGRDLFVQRVWKWKDESGGTILKQFKRLGFAYDWSRERFTMDPAYHDAVLKVFIDWYERGLIYRGRRIVNWDPGLQTSVSDVEVYDEVRTAKLYHFRYPFMDGSGHVVIATTRPETMLADVAVAVNPSDMRYKNLIGKTLRLPIMNREIPLIADEYPDPEFGSGAVKVTPAHDPNDYEVGLRMGLDMSKVPVCIDEHAKINAPTTRYHGLDRFDARKKIVAEMEAQGLLEKVEDYEVPLKISDRSGQVIEPLLSEQWFCKMKEIAAPAIEAVRSGRIKFTPERYADIYLKWMENIRDWCLSRQLWWGHRVPIYYTEEGEPIAALHEHAAEKKARGPVTPDPDVLDTWFSSALWPFATLGWPDDTEDLRRYYPTNVIVTSRDIIYLWVARMIMDGLDQVKEIPFHDVYIYATVLTEQGQRMSKSLGTGVDPVQYIDRYGADAMRFSLLAQTGHNQEIRFGDKRIEEARNFCNKIWNASRFALMNLEGYSPGQIVSPQLEDKWVLSRLKSCADSVDAALNNYNMMDACKALHEFFWSEFCDWYIEVVKSRLTDSNQRATPQRVLHTCLDTFCKLMHPFMPHITEEIWHKLPGIKRDAYLSYSEWPSLPSEWKNEKAEREMSRRQEIIRAARNLRQEFGLSPGLVLPVLHVVGFVGDTEMLRTQARFEWVDDSVPKGIHVSATVEGVDIHLPIEGLVDPAKETVRLEKSLEKQMSELRQLRARLDNSDYVARAKSEVVERDREMAKNLEEQIAKTTTRLEQFRNMI